MFFLKKKTIKNTLNFGVMFAPSPVVAGAAADDDDDAKDCNHVARSVQNLYLKDTYICVSSLAPFLLPEFHFTGIYLEHIVAATVVDVARGFSKEQQQKQQQQLQQHATFQGPKKANPKLRQPLNRLAA